MYSNLIKVNKIKESEFEEIIEKIFLEVKNIDRYSSNLPIYSKKIVDKDYTHVSCLVESLFFYFIFIDENETLIPLKDLNYERRNRLGFDIFGFDKTNGNILIGEVKSKMAKSSDVTKEQISSLIDLKKIEVRRSEVNQFDKVNKDLLRKLLNDMVIYDDPEFKMEDQALINFDNQINSLLNFFVNKNATSLKEDINKLLLGFGYESNILTKNFNNQEWRKVFEYILNSDMKKDSFYSIYKQVYEKRQKQLIEKIKVR